MQRNWIVKNGGRCLTLFFCGWGMDERAIRHVKVEGDLIVFYDYRDISDEKAPDTSGYSEVRVVAWSMGVWAASVLLERWDLPVNRRIAINGTGRPVDEKYGIHPRVYLLTERGMTEQGRDKFFDRMLSGEEERQWFEKNKPGREIEEQVEELRAIREQSTRLQPQSSWDRTYISRGDVIFPVENQRNWWNGRCEIIDIEGGHYPFYVLTDLGL